VRSLAARDARPTAVDRSELRYTDFGLDHRQAATPDVCRDFITKGYPATVIRAAEPMGHDDTLRRA
jgi:hypothetical protein